MITFVYRWKTFLIQNQRCLSPVSRVRIVLLLIVPPIAFEVDWRGRVRLAERNRLAVRADCLRVVHEVLEELEVSVAIVTMISIEWHN